jgi:hypothetical protein
MARPFRQAPSLGLHGELHEEAHGIAMRATSEAVEKALLVVDREGWRLLVV